jgi:porphobilinogen synthase
MRRLVTETRLHIDDFVYPLFVSETASEPEAVATMPGIYRWPLDRVADEARRASDLGIGAFLLFGIPKHKDAEGSTSLDPNGVIPRAAAEIKQQVPEMLVIADVCLCEYTDHGHCGILKDRQVDNDATVKVLAQQALNFARAGVDMVAPSDMMDGRVLAIREALDAEGFVDTPIMAYAAKYASAFYGPFREAAGSAPQFGDRKSYQMDPPNVNEAIREIRQDVAEGADIVMVKPALAYLDVIARARKETAVPLAAYNVSGEYTMAKLAASGGVADERQLVMEIMTAIKRAGADIIISYHAPDVARWLK